MDWRDEGILIAARRHGESSAIVEVFTAGHGRHAGVVRGGAGRRMAPVLQPGARLVARVVGAARGAYRHLPRRSDAVADGGDHGRRRGAGDARGDDGAPVGDAAGAGRASGALRADASSWSRRWARRRTGRRAMPPGSSRCSAELGFGLDLERCAVTGGTDELVWVSPKSGRAVSREAGAPWADRLLPLPAFLRGLGGAAGAGRGAAGAGADRLLPRGAGGAGAAARGAAGGAGAGGGGDSPRVMAGPRFFQRLPGLVVAGRRLESGWKVACHFLIGA